MGNNKDCIFCKIASGEIPSTTIFENEEFKVILDLFPANKGHVLIIPKNHVSNFFEMEEEQASRIFKLANRIAKALEKSLPFDGMNVIQNNGEVAGQTVFHYHLHLIPRYNDDLVNVTWKPLKPSKEQLQEVADLIKKAI